LPTRRSPTRTILSCILRMRTAVSRLRPRDNPWPSIITTERRPPRPDAAGVPGKAISRRRIPTRSSSWRRCPIDPDTSSGTRSTLRRFARSFTGNRPNRSRTGSRKPFDGFANTNRGGSPSSQRASRNTTKSSIAGSEKPRLPTAWLPIQRERRHSEALIGARGSNR